MKNEVKVLDHGYVRLVEAWGSDEAIIEDARLSTQKGFEGWGPRCVRCDAPIDEGTGSCSAQFSGPCQGGRGEGVKPGDEKLLAFLWKNKHTTPFEGSGAKFEIQAPIFVFREWHRHRTQSYSEMSARYAPLPDVSYVPSVERLLANAGGTNRQANRADGAAVLDPPGAEKFRLAARSVYDYAQRVYADALADGVPKELARVVLPVGRYSRMRASANLLNWLRFLTLRDHPAAQREIRDYAEVVRMMLAERFPRTLALFQEGR